MLLRLPTAAVYASQVDREQRWLPVLGPQVTQPIPRPIATGHPLLGYPWKWSIHRWLPGAPARPERIRDIERFAADLGDFLRSLQAISSEAGSPPGAHTFHRGGTLPVYDRQTRLAIDALASRLHLRVADTLAAWDAALASAPRGWPVWVHGDISVGNLLVDDKGRLCGVIDFGQCCIGDPACDLAIAWTLFDDRARDVFRAYLPLDEGVWTRARAWALWKALIVAAGFTRTNAWEGERCWQTIDAVLADRRTPWAGLPTRSTGQT